jgi:hypothetical protein
VEDKPKADDAEDHHHEKREDNSELNRGCSVFPVIEDA